MAHWADRDLDLARKRGFIQGFPDGAMRPDEPVTRGQAAAIANRVYDAAKESFEDILSAVEPAVVMVLNGAVGAVGSGTSIGDGCILTNAHVADGADTLGIRWHAWGYGESGQANYAEGPVVYRDPTVDLAVVSVEIVEYRKQMPVLPLGDPAAVRKGEPVLVAGSPVGLIGTVTQGIVSYVGRRMTWQFGDHRPTVPDLIQTDAPINPGNSGGALVNRRGELIGVPSIKLINTAYEGLGFAIGMATVQTALKKAGIRR